MIRRSVLLLATLLLALGLLAPTAAAQAALVPQAAHAAEPGQQGRAATTYAAKAHAATNAARAAQGLGALSKDRCLQRLARKQAQRMAATGELFHQDLGAVVKGCRLSTAGENIAHGYSSGTSVVVDGWMSSEGHRANILGPSWRAEGIAAARDADGRWWVAQVFGRTR